MASLTFRTFLWSRINIDQSFHQQNRNFQDMAPNGEEGWLVWEWQYLHIVGSPSTKEFNFGVFYSGLASNPGASSKSRMSAGCSWSHVASSFWLSPRSFFSSQRPPPHSLSWTSWYWKRKTQCVCACVQVQPQQSCDTACLVYLLQAAAVSQTDQGHAQLFTDSVQLCLGLLRQSAGGLIQDWEN